MTPDEQQRHATDFISQHGDLARWRAHDDDWAALLVLLIDHRLTQRRAVPNQRALIPRHEVHEWVVRPKNGGGIEGARTLFAGPNDGTRS